MGMNFSTLVYKPAFNLWARRVEFYPLASQPGKPAYRNRGIFHSDEQQVILEDGSLFVDQRTTLDIREVEFAVLPQQSDRVVIPQDGIGGMPALGEFEIMSTWSNGGGETTLTLRKWLAAPVPPVP